MNVKKNEMQVINLPKVFTFNPSNQLIRVEVINNQAYFISKDVCDILGISNNRDVMTRLDEDEKLMSVVPTSGQNREMWFVNESGLYNLIFQSRKPEAKLFRKWVTGEVLPSLRKSGKYEVSKPETLALPAKRNHNRITRERMVSILSDVCRIDNSELRASLTNKLLGGHTV